MVVWGRLLLDSILLSVILFPILYFFAFRPLTLIISELQIEKEKVRKSEEKFSKASRTSPDLINISRLSDGMIVSVNEAFTKILGYTEVEAVGKTSIELNLWADEEDRKIIVKELQEKGRVDNFETIFLKTDGNIVNVLMSASLIDLGGVNHILTVTKDISLRKRVEEKLAREQFLVNALMDNLTDHIYFKDRESRFIRVNKAQSVSLGLNDPASAVGKTDFDFFTDEHAKQAYEDEQNIIRTGEPLNIEEKETHPYGTDTWVSTVKMPLRNENGEIIGTFGISRDMDEIKDITKSMKTSASNIYSLLENLLEWSRLRRGVMDFVPENFNLKKKISDSIKVLSEYAGKKGIIIGISIPDQLEVIADNHMFDAVIRNLVSNAIKFTPAGGKVSVSADYNSDRFIEVKINDSGIGMTHEMRDKLFLMNEKTRREGTEGEPSTGLGLLLCKEFIEKHNGKIWVESEALSHLQQAI